MDLSKLKQPEGQVKKQRRVGRGMGSGRSKTAGRGMKGQKSISGYSHMRGFEGGQMPMHRRLPKRGFSNARFKKHFAIVNVSTLEKLEADTFTPESLLELGVIQEARRRAQSPRQRGPDPQDHRHGSPVLQVRRGEDQGRRRYGDRARRLGHARRNQVSGSE
jgi:ribosomal protein L15